MTSSGQSKVKHGGARLYPPLFYTKVEFPQVSLELRHFQLNNVILNVIDSVQI